jgi:small-conductance mechanosensitive channel
MITLGFWFVIPAGAVFSSTLMQGAGILEGISMSETMPWREIGLTAAVLLGAWLVRRVGRLFLGGTVEDRVVEYRWGKTLAYLTLTLTTVFIIAIWVDGLSQIGTFLGLVSAGVAIALKDLLVDFAGWLMLITKPPFEVGDRIQIGPHSGDVVDTSMLHFHLVEIGNWVDSDQSTGRLIRIPNSKILTDPIANYTSEFPFLWHEIPVVVTFESDWRRAKELLLDMVTEATKETSRMAADSTRKQPSRMLMLVGTVTATVYTSVLDHGICLSMRFLTDPRRRRGFDQTLWEGTLDIMSNEPDIQLAYPTQRLVGLEREAEAFTGTPTRTRRELVER